MERGTRGRFPAKSPEIGPKDRAKDSFVAAPALGMKWRRLGVKMSQPEPWEEAMRKTRMLAAAVTLSAVLGAANFALAAGEGGPPPPEQPKAQPPSGQKAHTKKPKPTKNSTSFQEDFLKGYHAAYVLIYDKADYVGAIAALRALGYDDHPDVATLIGYASRKLGRYDDAKYWYDKALVVDPSHATTLSYYGMWYAEQGNLLKAKDYLEKVRSACGTDCSPYKQLTAAIDGTVTY
jgi:tetratricopeptide (TPR) repeat protein